MSVCVEKITHDKCGGSGLQVFQQEDGTIDGYCFSCGTFVEDPYNGGSPPEVQQRDPVQIEESLKEFSTYPVKGMPARKLKEYAMGYFGVRSQVSEQDGETVEAVMFPYGKDGKLLAWKIRSTTEKKRQWVVGHPGGLKDSMFFGWARAIRSGQKTLYITEGEYDAVALYQILKDSNKRTAYADTDPAVVSLKSGAGSARKDVSKFLPEIKKYFREVVIVFDTDEAGKEAAEAASRAIGSGIDVKVAQLPCKDVNDCLMEGASKACKSAVVFNSSAPKGSRLVRGTSLREAAREPAQWGLSWPWSGLNELTRGIRRGETLYFGAGVKMG